MRSTLISIHDVMPETMELVSGQIDLLDQVGITKCTLLVVPGCDWSSDQIKQLHRWNEQGFELAGHGWVHRCERVKGVYHRLHSLVISRDIAEHLELSPEDRFELMSRCADWFEQQKLPQPALYVPPAWAMGRLKKHRLQELPFRWFEVLSGVWDSESNRLRRSPLMGFEADTGLRWTILKLSNRCNEFAARVLQRPIRLSLHPYDLELLLRDDVRHYLANAIEPIFYSELDTDRRLVAS